MLLTRHGELDALVFESAWPTPQPGPGEVVIRVDACAINNTDINTRVGWYAQGDDNGAWGEPLRFPIIQGADVCGVIAAVGEGVPHERVGERVVIDPWVRDPVAPDDLDRAGYVGSELNGGYADYLAVPAINAYGISARLSAVQLASFATSAGTALDMLRRAKVEPGERVLITGASGGVGSYAVQLARAFGAIPVGVCDPSKASLVREFGAVETIDRAADPTALEPFDVAVDVVGGPQWSSLLLALRRGGRYVVAGAIGGPIVELDLRTLYLNDLVLIGATITEPTVFAELVELIERDVIKPVVAATFALEQVYDAQRMFVEKQFVGKIVLDLAGR